MKRFFVQILLLIQPLVLAVNGQTIGHTVDSLAAGFKGTVGIYAVNLTTGDTLSFNADRQFATASVIKIFVLGKLYQDIKQGKLSLDKTVILHDSAKVPGSGILLFMHDGLHLTIADLSWLMINMSDNVATNLLVDQVGGIDEVTAFIQAQGLKKTKMLAKIFDKHVYSDSAERKIYGIGVTTPRETGAYLSQLWKGQVVDSECSKLMVDLMKYQFYDTSIPRFLPTYRDTIEIAHKTGALDDTRNDCGIIFTPRDKYILCVYTNGNSDQRWITDNSAEVFIAKVSKLIYDDFVK